MTDYATGGASTPPVISVQGLSHAFTDQQTRQTVHALDDVNLDISNGEFVTVVGPSGCGKTTLLNILAGFLAPEAGQAFANGRLIEKPGKDRGVVFQELAIMPWRSVARNIAHGLEIQRVPKPEIKERVAAMVDLMGLAGFENHHPHQLSGGMRQRVAVARTWVSDPDIILMDEPFAAVDSMTRSALQEELSALTVRTNKTVFFITHSVEEAVFLGDRVIAMTARPGRIKAEVQVPIPRSERTRERMSDDGELRECVRHVLSLVHDEAAQIENPAS